MIEDTLRRINATELIGGRDAWGGVKMAPYTLDEMNAFDRMDATRSSAHKADHAAFQRELEALTSDEREALASWAQGTFVDPMWSVTRDFPRPGFAHKRFFSKAPKSGAMLDIAPAHGCHGALLYRDHYGYGLEVHTCDLMPAYNKLLAILGLKVKHVDLRFDRLNVEYQQKFDVITMTEMLEHVDEQTETRVCADLHDITRLGSMVLVTFPEVALPHGAPQANDPLGHVRQPSVNTVVEKLHGFKKLESGLFSGGKCNQQFIILERE